MKKLKVTKVKGFKAIISRYLLGRLVTAFCMDTINIGPDEFIKSNNFHIYSNCIWMLEHNGYKIEEV